jgi:hypothetical protein
MPSRGAIATVGLWTLVGGGVGASLGTGVFFIYLLVAALSRQLGDIGYMLMSFLVGGALAGGAFGALVGLCIVPLRELLRRRGLSPALANIVGVVIFLPLWWLVSPSSGPPPGRKVRVIAVHPAATTRHGVYVINDGQRVEGGIRFVTARGDELLQPGAVVQLYGFQPSCTGRVVSRSSVGDHVELIAHTEGAGCEANWTLSAEGNIDSAALLVPLSAATQMGEQVDSVWVAVPQTTARYTAAQRQIVTGWRTESREPELEIRSGLSEGELLILEPELMREGEPVQVEVTSQK